MKVGSLVRIMNMSFENKKHYGVVIETDCVLKACKVRFIVKGFDSEYGVHTLLRSSNWFWTAQLEEV